MNWDRIEGNWAECTSSVNERWGHLNDGQLAGRVQDAYGMSNREDTPQCQLSDWQQHVLDMERVSRRRDAPADAAVFLKDGAV
jgi:hypothetical protein